MDYNTATVTRTSGVSIEINKVLKNTYLLLSATLIFSAAMAGVSMSMNAGHPGIIIWLVVTFGLLFAVNKTAESAMGIVLTFAFTGWLGFTLGPLLSMYMAMHGSGIIMQALGGTGLIFFALSGYVLTTKKDFSFLRGILFAGLMVVIFSMIFYFVGSYFFGLHISGFSLALSAIIILLMSGFILFDTSSIIRGEQTNYVMATVSMYLNLYNIFIHLLHLLSAFDD
ncbi:MAG: Bax inhibitor-1/YccA family protein [Gammaproteobacteria bacterium]|nr:Bax inhibitor-1/YccA family protein [Gammaproteobacteria bacterium]